MVHNIYVKDEREREREIPFGSVVTNVFAIRAFHQTSIGAGIGTTCERENK
jgi:hypothetical protein